MSKRKVWRPPEPFEHVRVEVTPVSFIGQPPHGLTVGIMDELDGQGSRSSLEYAEVEAKTVLKAIRAYRRANPAEGESRG